MKKQRLCTVFLAVVLLLTLVTPLRVSAAGSEPGYVIDFYYESDYRKAGVMNISACTVTWENNALKVVAGEDALGDTNFMLGSVSASQLSCDDYPYVAIRLKNLSEGTQFEGHFGTEYMGLSGYTVFHFPIEANMKEFKNFVFYMPDANLEWANKINGPDGIAAQEGETANLIPEMFESAWYGTLNTLRLDSVYFGGRSGMAPAGTECQIEWIAFFETEEAAKAYTGPDHSSEPTATPEPPPLQGDDLLPGLTLQFDRDGYYYELFGIASSDEFDVRYNAENKSVQLVVPVHEDPYISLDFRDFCEAYSFPQVNCDEYKVFQMKVKINPNAGSDGKMYFATTVNGGYSEGSTVSFGYEPTEEWQIINLDFSALGTWGGELVNLRYDMFPLTNIESVIDIEYFAFFKNMQAAEAFVSEGGEFPTTPEPSETPEPPKTTATPEPTETSAPTAAATPVPEEKSGCGSVITGGMALAAVMTGAVVFLGKKKKK